MSISEAVRSLRKRLGKNQAQLAFMLGCQRNTVSRYELGGFPPGPLVLMRLLQIAKSAGASAPEETAAIMRHLRLYADQGHIGGGQTADETIALMLSASAQLLGQIQIGGQIMDILPDEKRQNFGFRQFIPAVSRVIAECDTVDQSITDMLLLWAAHSQNETALQYFREAVGFLRGQLWVRQPSRPAPEKQAASSSVTATSVTDRKALQVRSRPRKLSGNV